MILLKLNVLCRSTVNKSNNKFIVNKFFSLLSKFNAFAVNKNRNCFLLISNTNKTNNRFRSDMSFKEINVPMPWGSIKAQVYGDPTSKKLTPILCLHGFLDNSNSFKPLAPKICRDEYYLISVDLPGHGFSSSLPLGIPYTPKLFLSSIRRLVKYLELKDFIFLTHSYGTLVGLMYASVFTGEVKSLIALDWVFSDPSKRLNPIEYWKIGIDGYIEAENNLSAEMEKIKNKTLTHSLALSYLLKANDNLDEESAKILLERALIVKEDGKLHFSRDSFAKLSMTLKNHYLDFIGILPHIPKYLNVPILMIHADPASYGTKAKENTFKTINYLNENLEIKIELETIEGTHHFHMIKPKETAEILLKFLDKLKLAPSKL